MFLSYFTSVKVLLGSIESDKTPGDTNNGYGCIVHKIP